MNLQTNFTGRLRNTTLPLTNGLLPVYEAVVNSIHSIEEAQLSMDQGVITVEILRNPTPGLNLDDRRKTGPEPREEIIGFKVIDNGIGFNEANMKSFLELDTDYKVAKGCRGVGRLIWLKAFRQAVIESSYSANGTGLKKRSFVFDSQIGIREIPLNGTEPPLERKTTIHLQDFKPRYRDTSRKTAKAIGEGILEHCLWYFIRKGSAPLIDVVDGDETLSLQELFDAHMHSSAVVETVTIKGAKFELSHVKLRTNSSSTHVISLCADQRLVIEEKLTGKIPGLHGRLSDGSSDFIYSCYVSSDFLDDRVRAERTGFDIADEVDGLFKNTEISLGDIRDKVIERAQEHLKDELSEVLMRSKERIERFVATKGPRYRPILGRIPPDRLQVDPNASDKELDLTLHKHLFEIEVELLDEGHDIIAPKLNEGMDEYRQRLAEYLKKAEDIKRSDLANYVSHRKVILELLEKVIERGPNGKYAREDMIHNLIMPMQQESSEVLLDHCNLWLIDERLAFHDYLASDKTLASMPITGNVETKEPGLCALTVFDNPILVSEGSKLPLASIVVVEIKRPMRNDAAEGEEKDPVEQALGYLDRIRAGKVTTKNGRPIPESDNSPGFCYVLSDLTPTFIKRCRVHHDLKPTADKMGFFGYKTNANAYVEVISFNRLVNAAKERNRAFFDKLGLPTT
ncbi:MAG: hypothetical protein JJU00_20440 [Opitutales bacterium]|nr:hypothetical protein [Opitutales bacterium]